MVPKGFGLVLISHDQLKGLPFRPVKADSHQSLAHSDSFEVQRVGPAGVTGNPGSTISYLKG